MSDMWKKISETWDILAPPLRPHSEVVRAFEREIDMANSDILLLGVTPEFARWGKTMVAVNAMENMIGALWVGDDSTRKAVLGNWMDLPIEDNSLDAVVGDGCLTALPNQDARLAVLGQIARVLKPGGSAAIRLFARPEVSESLDAIKADVLDRRMSGISELVLRLSIYLSTAFGDAAVKMNAVLDAIDEMFPDREALLAATGWSPNVFDMVQTFMNSDTVCCWVNEAGIAQEASRHFGDVRIVSSGDYSAAHLCPLLVLEKPLKETL